ncbi:HNH endonuclease [Vulcanococcus limneticus]|uniref:HNH endonuclease n=1 Tax=Vulcanococcus limneticus TaxID=2170428 RepID=UPI00398C211C
MQEDKVHAIVDACHLVENGDIEGASRLIGARYPFRPLSKSARAYTPRAMTKIFVRDGFIDRYRGDRLVYPPALRLLSHYMPDAFPYHKNGKMSVGHYAYWELFPTIDHVVPVALGGPDIEDNWACCSMLTNSIKSNWTLDQLRWSLLLPGDFTAWDGMVSWFLRRVEQDASVLVNLYVRQWYRAALEVTQGIDLVATQ